MIKGYRKSASAAKAEGSARSAGEKNLTVKVDVAYPLMNDVRSDNFTIKVEPPEEPLDAPTLKLSINFEAEESLAEVMEFGPHLCERYQTSAPHRKRERRNLRM